MILHICKAMGSTLQNIVTVLYISQLPESRHELFLDMELCDLSLEDYLYPGSSKDHMILHFIKDALPPSKSCQIWHIITHITSGIQFLHSLNLVHRDLKPSNGTLPPILEEIHTHSTLLTEGYGLENRRF